jgi:cation diffusion facilitator CzcD-associated flavoprotein CzcO
MLSSFRLRLSPSALLAGVVVAFCALTITLPSGSTCMALSSHANAKSHRRPEPPKTVVVIGSGPGGMFFLHALASLRQKLQQEGDDEALAALPLVTTFERDSSPGGVWKSSSSSAADATNYDDTFPFKNSADQAGQEEDHAPPKLVEESKVSDGTSKSRNNDTAAAAGSTNMYEGLWINGPSQAIEFADYTYDDHFQRALPIFLPRKSVLEYLLARVTSKEDIFQHVKFDTTVQSVRFEEALEKFVIVTVDNFTGETSVGHYDKCIWAAGLNGKPRFASNIKKMLSEQKFKGQVVHSTEMGSLTSSVQGKRIMLIGDSYSAEDLALQCLKLGAEKVYITSRHGNGIASYVTAWPGNRVEVLDQMLPCGVTDDGNGILCGMVDYKEDEEEEDEESSSDESRCNAENASTVKVTDVSIVIFCTGYEANMDFLDSDLKSWWTQTDKLGEELPTPVWSVPDGWRMKNNSLSAILGTVKPSTELRGESPYVTPGLYRQNLLIRNPNMMFFFETSEFPLLSIDVNAWLLLGYITGTVQVPTAHTMERRNSQQLLREMQQPHLRYALDEKYWEKYQHAVTHLIPASHWLYNITSEESLARLEDSNRYDIGLLAQGMKDGGYPFSLGTHDKLNDAGEQFVRMTSTAWFLGYNQLDEDSEDSEWRTFRDIDPHGFSSLITGTEAVHLPGKWMELDEGLIYANYPSTKSLIQANYASTKPCAASCECDSGIV